MNYRDYACKLLMVARLMQALEGRKGPKRAVAEALLRRERAGLLEGSGKWRDHYAYFSRAGRKITPSSAR